MFGKHRKTFSPENADFPPRKSKLLYFFSGFSRREKIVDLPPAEDDRWRKNMNDMILKKIEPKKIEAASVPRFVFAGIFKKIRPPEISFFKDFFRNSAKKRKIAIFTFAAFLIIFGFWLFLKTFSRLTLKITPYQEFFKAETVLKGGKDGLFDFPVEIINFKITENDFRPTTGKEEIKSKAIGWIVIYNAFSSEDQTLVKRTRFETPDGKTYRISKQVVVPGAEIKDGKIMPASVEAEIFADQPGEEYNIGLADFTIPGFKGTARYSKFYARSKTILEGGFIGTARVVSEKDAEEAEISLKNKLNEEIKREYKKQIPEDLILLEGAYEIFYEKALFAPLAGERGEDLTTTLSANFRGFLVKKEYFSKALVKAYLGADFIDNAAAVNFDQINKNIVSRDFEKGEIVLKASNVHLARHFNESDLKTDLLAGKKSFNKIFSVYDEIERAELIFWPSWWRRVPSSADRLKIEKVLEVP